MKAYDERSVKLHIPHTIRVDPNRRYFTASSATKDKLDTIARLLHEGFHEEAAVQVFYLLLNLEVIDP